MAAKKGVKIFLVITGILITVIFICFFYAEGFIKGKLIDAIEEHTDYKASIAVLSFRGFDGAEISGFEVSPKLNKEDFNKANGFQKDWIRIKSGHITIVGANWLKLIMTKHINFDTLILDKADIYAFRNKKLPQPPYIYKPLPGQQLRETKLELTIPLVQVKNGKIAYEELPEKGDKSGTISFTEFYASLYHLSTNDEYSIKEPTIIAEGKAKILDSIPAEVVYKFHLKNNKSSFEAKIKSFSATVLNQAINPLANAEIESGHVNWVHLKFDADNSQSNGFLNISYKDLKLKILSKDQHKHKSKFKSFAANLLVHTKNEPEAGDEESEGEIKFNRRKDRYIFNFWWNSVKSGVLSSVTKVNIPPPKK